MDTFINKNYNIIETYEKNEFQEIQMGTEINNPDNIIVINTLKKLDQYSNNLKSVLENSLQNLEYIEANTDNAITFVTNYHEGISLNDYLKSSKISDEHRKKIAQDYLNIINKYDPIDNNLKNILVDPKQININNNQLVLNELLLIADDTKVPFSKVSETIGKTLNLILGTDSFIEGLVDNSANFTSIKSISKAFHSRYSDENNEIEDYDYENFFSDVKSDDNEDNEENSTIFIPPIEMVSDDPTIQSSDTDAAQINDDSTSEIELTSLGFIDEANEPDFNDKNKNKGFDFNNKYIVPIAVILLLLLGIVFANNILFNDDLQEYTVSFTREKIDGGFRFTANVPDADEEYIYEWKFLSDGEELATFEKPSIPIEFKNEGNYTITLRVQNSDKQWSKTFTDEFYYSVENLDSIDETKDSSEIEQTKDTFDNYTIKYQTNNITDDYENKYTGDRSLKFDFNDDNPTAKIKLEGVLLKDQVNISFQIKSSTREPIEIDYIGLVGNTEIFEKSRTYTPELENTWVMLPITIETPNADDLELTFTSMDTTVWIDKIEIENYK